MSKKSKAEKAERKAAERAAQLAAEKAERKAAKKAGKKKAVVIDAAGAKHKGVLPMSIALPSASEPDPLATGPGDAIPAPKPESATLAAAEKVLNDPNASPGAKKKAVKAKTALLGGLDDAALKARVLEKRAARDAHEATAGGIDRDDEAAVAAYNARLVELGGGNLLTSTPERDRRAAALEEAAADPAVWKAPAHIAEVVATEEGDVIAVGPERTPLATVADETIALPSEAPAELATNGNGQYKIKRPSDGRIVGYTRATTYIDNLEDKSALDKWKMRTLIEGAAVAEIDLGRNVLVEARDLLHVRDVAIAKARKADRKGKLTPGQLGSLIADAEREWKRGAQAIAESMLEVGGAHVKREKGTDLHALCELADEHGIAAVEAKVAAEEATPADLADVRSYLAACEKAGLKMLEAETVIVNDELKVAGRLDRIAMYRREGAGRATKVVADVKTGRVDYSAGKIAQQIRLYATGERYDLDTHERSPLGVSKALGLLIHLPAGEATCTIYEVDLTLGARGVKLSGEVRAWRNEGKKAFDLKAPVVTYSTTEAGA